MHKTLSGILFPIFLFMSIFVVGYVFSRHSQSIAHASMDTGIRIYEIGEEKTILENYVLKGELDVLLIVVGEHCNIWIDVVRSQELSQEQYDLVAERIDSIYEIMCESAINHTGSWGDIDNDGKVNIILCDLSAKNISGYYEMGHLRKGACSNSWDLIFLDISRDLGLSQLKKDGGKEFFATFAHEFQHLLNDIACNNSAALNDYNTIWLNESVSALASYLFVDDDYLDQRLFSYIMDDFGTADGLFYNSYEDIGQKEYLMSMLFGVYLYRQFGETVFSDIYMQYKNGLYGKDAIAAVTQTKFGSFEAFFDAFIIATFFDGVTNTDIYNIFDKPIVISGIEYQGIFDFRFQKKMMFYPTDVDVDKKNYTSCRWSGRMLYYTDSFLKGKNVQKFDFQNANIFYCKIKSGFDRSESTFLVPTKYKDRIEYDENESILVLFIANEKSLVEIKCNLESFSIDWRLPVIIVLSSIAFVALVFAVVNIARGRKHREKV